MFEQDYVMRLIRDCVRAAVKLVFHVESEELSPYMIENPEARQTAENLLEKSSSGKIMEAEQELSAMLEQNTLDNLLIGLTFYSHLSEMDEEFLQEHHFSSEDAKNGLKSLLSKYGLQAMADTFFFET